MKTIIVEKKVRYIPSTEKECDFLLCENCYFVKTPDCFRCVKSKEKIEQLESEILKLKKQIKSLKKA